MGVAYNSRIVTDGLVLNYDFGNFQKAFGTTNLITNTGLSVYNNVPSHVTASITQTSETYKQSPVWALTLTPTTATGVSYLTSANNPGIGVVTGGGGGTGGVYTGHSIFFKSSVTLYGPAPIYTHYSNIGGWQSTGNYDDMGDGWYRANVIWYDTVTRSDGKYWAINPASATLNVPMTIYWAAPFKESQNYSSFVSPYTSNTRGSGSGVVNLVSQSDTGGTLTNGPTYSSANGGSFVFDGTNDYVDFGSDKLFKTTGGWTVSSWINLSQVNYGNLYNFIGASVIDYHSWYWTVYQQKLALWNVSPGGWYFGNTTIQSDTWYNAVLVSSDSGTQMTAYLNGVNDGGTLGSYSWNASYSGLKIGYIGRGDSGNGRYFYGKYPIFSAYNRALTAAEVSQNFNSNRGRFGI